MPRAPLALAALLLAGCAEPVSNALFEEDAAFLAALPSAERSEVHVPERLEPGTGGAKGAGDEPPPLDEWTGSTAAEINAFVERVLELVDQVRAQPPSERGEDYRRWGPWSVSNLGGKDLLVTIQRTGLALFDWDFSLEDGSGGYQAFLWGSHEAGSSVAEGEGSFCWDATTLSELVGEGAEGLFSVDYDNRQGHSFLARVEGYAETPGDEPRDALAWYAEDEGGAAFEYEAEEDVDGGGLEESIGVVARWTAEEALRVDAWVAGGDLEGAFRLSQCWDEAGELVFQGDTAGIYEERGSEADCAFPEAAAPEHLLEAEEGD